MAFSYNPQHNRIWNVLQKEYTKSELVWISQLSFTILVLVSQNNDTCSCSSKVSSQLEIQNNGTRKLKVSVQ